MTPPARRASAAAPGAADRLGRLLALVPYLTARPGARVEDVAKAFGIDEERLLDDLQILFVCGLPGHMPDDLIEATFEGGVIHVSNADTIARPLRLSADEALALLVGLQALADIPGLTDREALDRTRAKLARAAGDAASASEQVAVTVEAEETATATVRDALARGRRLHLDYYVPGRDETTERDVDPMRVLVVEGRTYLEGWCHRAEAVRLFRLDRVHAVQVLDVPAVVPKEAVSRNVDEGAFSPSPDDELVTLELDRAARWVAEYYPVETVTERRGGRLRVTLRVADDRWVTRLVLRLGGAAHVVEPASLAEAVRAAATSALDAYTRTA